MDLFNSVENFIAIVEGDDGLCKMGDKIVMTDYTAMEAHFTKELFEACEFQLYDHVGANNPTYAFYRPLITSIALMNFCKNKYMSYKVPATRMSGEMCTSLGNGFTNLMVILFLWDKLQRVPTVDDFAKLGMTVKMESVDEISKGSFCGMLFDPETHTVITEPTKVLLSTMYTNRRYLCSNAKTKKKLLIAKAYSICYQYPGCPILQNFGKMLLRCLKGVRINDKDIYGAMDTYRGCEIWQALISTNFKIPDKPITDTVRFLFEEEFGWTYNQQMKAEKYFDSLSDLNFTTFDLDISEFCGNDILDYSNKYLFDSYKEEINCDMVPLVDSKLLFETFDSIRSYEAYIRF
jgi:hypothetical protein